MTGADPSGPLAAVAVRRANGQFAARGAAPRGSAGTLWLLGVSPAAVRRGAGAREEERVTTRVLGLVASHAALSAPSALSRHYLTRQVTLTDALRPEADRPGCLLLSVRHPADSVRLAAADTPPGRRPGDVGDAWARLFEASACGSGRAESGYLRAGLLSFNFLVAACAEEYDARDAAEAVRTHVTANYGGRRVGARLERLADCLRAMVRCRVFPHQTLRFLGGLASWVTQDDLASVTAVCAGPQEVASTGNPGAPRSTVTVPACAFLDVDAECGLAGPGAAFLYLVFVYRQRLGQEMCRAYVAMSRLPARGLTAALERLFGRLRVTNTIHGTEGAEAPRPPPPEADLPLWDLIAEARRWRGPAAPAPAGGRRPRPYRWHPDLRGRPTARSCTYAAFSEIGLVPEDLPRVTRRAQTFGSVSVPVVLVEGVVWRPDDWVECA
ncbi:capsid triplex subunit 1 [Ateline alphaherpesvirus 1]|uniref:Capsid triplex subunit 1 n=1 Tax=Herpesvirus ateles type 1 (strain Lennette) TaxID=35243 RepID=A0A1S6JLL7_HSVA1|nr:capsid triplex subunit 1 [Ateline alphaherpesvirus 1]AQS79177.1 capsid triplex subunit 1 [Ateline alphaherpesvirus 1]